VHRIATIVAITTLLGLSAGCSDADIAKPPTTLTTGKPAPVVPTATAPVVPTATAPVVPTTTAPVVPTTTAPVVPTATAINDLEVVCKNPEEWFNYGVGASDLILTYLEIRGGQSASLDATDVAMFSRHSRDGMEFARQTTDNKLASAFRRSAHLYSHVAHLRHATGDDGANLMHRDRVVADRCDLLLAESDLHD